jgi:FKBP-type peptidyl-prolyl cis-trans isomerase
MRSHRLIAPLVVAAALLAGCGDSADEAAGDVPTTTVAADTTAAPGASATPNAEKPEVVVPESLPAELVITDLTEGTGAAAAEGDTVLVNYVGVRSVDGTEFDNSYDGGQPFPVKLGQGGVIAGWDQGLVGVKAGGRRQLDIPPELAYGDQPQGDIIQAGDALTFVIDVIAVIGPSDPADAPTDAVETSTGATEVTTTDITVGDGTEVVEGSDLFVEIVAYRGDTAEEINSTWGQGPVQLTAAAEQMIPGLYEGLLGMKAGGRRQMVLPPAAAFGDAGNADLGLPEATDLVLVVDVVAVI